MNEVLSCRALVHRLVDEYLDAVERVPALQRDA